MSKNKITVLDGGFSSQLIKYDTNFDNHPLWSAWLLYKNPQLVYQVHLDYLRAGADIISTNTYQASVEGFQKHLDSHLTEQQCLDLITTAVQKAKDARSIYLEELKAQQLPTKTILIAGAVGPYGAILHDGSEYDGSYVTRISSDDLYKWHKLRINALIEAGVDLLALETIPAMKEAEVLIRLLKEYPEMKAWLTFSCKDQSSTSFGDNFQDVTRKCYDLNPEQLIAIGVNCLHPDNVQVLFNGLNEGRSENPVPLITYPNSGEKFDKALGWINKEQCKPLESYVPTWIQLGVQYIGSCCRTSDVTIANIRREVDKYMNQ